MSKQLIDFAKGHELIGSYKLIGTVKRTDTGHAFNLDLNGNIPNDLIIKICNTREDTAYFDSLDLSGEIETERKRLIFCKVNKIDIAPEDFGL